VARPWVGGNNRLGGRRLTSHHRYSANRMPCHTMFRGFHGRADRHGTQLYVLVRRIDSVTWTVEVRPIAKKDGNHDDAPLVLPSSTFSPSPPRHHRSPSKPHKSIMEHTSSGDYCVALLSNDDDVDDPQIEQQQQRDRLRDVKWWSMVLGGLLGVLLQLSLLGVNAMWLNTTADGFGGCGVGSIVPTPTMIMTPTTEDGLNKATPLWSYLLTIGCIIGGALIVSTLAALFLWSLSRLVVALHRRHHQHPEITDECDGLLIVETSFVEGCLYAVIVLALVHVTTIMLKSSSLKGSGETSDVPYIYGSIILMGCLVSVEYWVQLVVGKE
jgi:hypothetical protein